MHTWERNVHKRVKETAGEGQRSCIEAEKYNRVRKGPSGVPVNNGYKPGGRQKSPNSSCLGWGI